MKERYNTNENGKKQIINILEHSTTDNKDFNKGVIFALGFLYKLKVPEKATLPREVAKWLQATGLRETQFWDEKTKEIFEGDVIDWTYSDGIDLEQHGRFVVVLQNGAFRVGDDNDDETLYELLEDCDVKIVGNIYENKK